MANDLKLLAEAYLKVREAVAGNAFAPGNALQGLGNLFHRHIGNMPKERVDQYWNMLQQPIDPSYPYAQQQKAMRQKQYEDAKAQYEKEQQNATRQQVVYTPPTGGAGQPATATASSSTQAAPAGKGSLPGTVPTEVGGTGQPATTPTKDDLLKNISATDQAIKNAANPQLQNIQNSDKAMAAAMNKQYTPATPPATANASSNTQTAAPAQSTSRYMPKNNKQMGWGGRHPGRSRPGWASR